MDPLGEGDGAENQQRNGNKCQQCQFPIEPEQHGHDADQCQARRDNFLEAVHKNALHVLGVVQDPRHDFSRRAVLEKTDRQALKGGEHLHVQIMHDLLLETVVQLDSRRCADIPQHIGGAEPRKDE